MTWILIMYFVGSQTMTIGSVEFNNKQACEVAKTEMEKVGTIQVK